MNTAITQGNYIKFYLDRWDESGKHSSEIQRSKVLNLIVDPMGRYETKFMVKVNDESYGIPVSKVIELGPEV
jgi:hypothetical protein